MLVHNECPKDVKDGKGYDNFKDAKNALGPSEKNKAWHHIVEQNQIAKSGFAANDIHNTKNLVLVDSGFSGSFHSKISGYYSSKQPFTEGLRVRDWLVGQSFDHQFKFGYDVLLQYGKMTPTNTGWLFTLF